MKKFSLFIGLLTMLFACKNSQNTSPDSTIIKKNRIEIQGHRGDRGSFPENTIPSFYSAIEKGVDVIEIDVVISKDNEVVVSHEPYMLSLYMLDPQGDSIPEVNQRDYNFYEMAYDSIRKFDAGSKGNRLFPDQKTMEAYKPLLNELIDSVENFVEMNKHRRVRYNIELKSTKNLYGKYQPFPEEFVDLVMEVVIEKGIERYTNIQSFDIRILNYLHKAYPHMKVGYLVESVGIDKQLAKLDFKPDYYNPYFKLVKSREFVDSVRTRKMKLIPWTVNNYEDIEKMIELEVDGIITDFPERVIEKQ
ncbi:MAG TPA: glycerophosphodiester phosphodiesterase family protein [Gillisia sp.]|nr:glycerophosphodiester phosphodiesterase family protein [Gillisia sp.]